MSYILDSLKRSDKERTLGSVPTLQSLPLISDAPPSKQSINAKWFILPAIMLLAAYIGSQLTVSDQPAPVIAPLAAPVTAIKATETSKSDTQTASKNTLVETDSANTTENDMKPETTGIQHSASDISVDIPETMPDNGFGISSHTQNRLKGVKVQLQDNKVKTVSQQKAQPTATATTPNSREKQPAKTAKDRQLTASEGNIKQTLASLDKKPNKPAVPKRKDPPVSDPYRGIMHARQLPESMKRELPELNFSVHIYSANAASRMVKINGRNVRQGENVTQNLTLDEITRDGVIMTFKDQRFWQLSR